VKEETEKEEKEWPESLITTSDEKSEDVKDNLVVFPGADLPTKEDSKEERAQILATPKDEQISSDIIEETETKKEVDLIIDNLLEDDAMRQRSDSAARYIENNPIEYTDPDEGNTGFWMIMLTGFILLGASIAASLRGAEEIMGQWGPVLVLAGLMIGGLMILGAAYYAVRRLFR
jgi:hypothetical protein